MRPTKTELIARRTTKFSKSDLLGGSVFAGEIGESSDSIGGVIRKGQLGWLARGPLLEVFSLRNSNKISSYRFDLTFGFQRCYITCVTEIDNPSVNYCLLAVGIQFGEDPGGMVAIYSVQESKVLRGIETADKITSCHLIGEEVTRRTILGMFQGCLAIGTDAGKIILLDLCLRRCEKVIFESRSSDDDASLVPCHVVLSAMDSEHIKQHFRHSRAENVGFGIQLEVIDDAGLILSLLSLTPLLALAAGLEDGRLILYDLTDLQAFHLAYPPRNASPLAKLSFLEPPDDPRACAYIWAFHENPQSSIAVMHSVMYDRKITDDDSFCIYEDFQSCSVRLTLPMHEPGSLPVSCQSVTKFPSHDNEDTISLCLLAWKSRKTSELLVFDINQWYKEQMPNIGDWRNNLSYLASFPLVECVPLDVWIDGRTIAPFNSIQRPEEHFFPVSLSFDCILLEQKGSINLHWPGLQNRALELLNVGGPSALLEPSVYFHEIAKASLIPQFVDYNFNSSVSINVQRDTLLSVALEYNCFGLLKECAKCWADGSHLGRKPDESLSLSTLTTWIWKQAESIKSRCNVLCVPLFDLSGLRIDQRSQKQLSHSSRQLKLLADLMNIIVTKCKEYIPEEVNNSLKTQYNSIRMASEYQEVVQWFLNVGLLPEAGTSLKESESFVNISFDSRVPLVPYPYKILRNYYMTQRMKFKRINSSLLSARTQSCRILYIDSFIEHECNASVLRDHWLESGGNGLYPPPSLQAMLRTLLVPDVSIENKYVLFVYLFLDLNMALENERYSDVVQNLIKFPAVFNLNSSMIKTIQAFWNLDHAQLEAALEDIISPFSHDRKLIQWQQELLIETLLVHHAPKLALRALQAPGPPISSLLELKTLLANDLIAEAFHLQRSKNNPELLRTFLTGCLYLGKMGALLDLALTEDEDRILEEFLRDSKSSKTENLHFVHLLQRSKYIEAVQQLDELSRSKHGHHRSVDLETPNLVLSAYNMTMTPATKHLSEVYYGIRNRLKAKEPEEQDLNPLSCQLLKHNANDLAGGIYHSSIMGVDEATNYWDEKLQRERTRLQCSSNVPFIRRPQLDAFTGNQHMDTISYPETYKGAQKRRLNLSGRDSEPEEIALAENPRKRQKIQDVSLHRKTTQPLNTTMLTQFRDRSVAGLNESEHKMDVALSKQNSQDKSFGTSLSTPIIKSSRSDFRDDSMSESSDFSKTERVCTPQSILKNRNTARSIPSSLRKFEESTPKRSVSPNVEQLQLQSNEFVDEEKSIRFDLPSANVTSYSSLQISRESFDMSLRVPSTSNASVAPEDSVGTVGKSNQFGGPKPRKALHSADSSLLSTTSAENEEFFSPQQSRDNSMKMDCNDDDKEVQKNEDTNEQKYKARIMDGPKARKSLERSRSRSKTPDIPSSPLRKSTRILEKTTQESTSILTSSSTESKQTITKSLTRLVLETNTKKASIQSTAEAQTLSQQFSCGHIMAQSTQILEARTPEAMLPLTEHCKTSELSTFDGDISLADLSSRQSSSMFVASKQLLRDDSEVSDSFKAEWNNRLAANSSLMTTMDISNFDITVDEEGLSRTENLLIDNSSLEFSKIGGRKSYKADQQEQPPQAIDEVNSEDETNEESENDDRILKQDQITTFETQVEDVEDDDEEDSDMSSHSTINVEDDQEEQEEEEDEEADDDLESESSVVISISSSDEASTQKAISRNTNSSDSRSQTPTKDNNELLYGDLDHFEEEVDDENKVLYGDLDERRTNDGSQSTVSGTTEPFYRDTSDEIGSSQESAQFSPAAQSVIDEQSGSSQELEPDLNQAVIEESNFTTSSELSSTIPTLVFTNSAIGKVESSLSINVLTGEYENQEEWNDTGVTDATADELNQGRLEATSNRTIELTVDELNRGQLEAISTLIDVNDSKIEPESSIAVADSITEEDASINILEQPILDNSIETSTISIPSVMESQNKEDRMNITLPETAASFEVKESEVVEVAVEKPKLSPISSASNQQSSEDLASSSATIPPISTAIPPISPISPAIRPISPDIPPISPTIPSTSKLQQSPEKTTVAFGDATIDMQLKVSDSDDNENDLVAGENLNSQGTSNKTKTPVRSSVENEITSQPDRILRSTRHRSISIDSKPEIDSTPTTSTTTRILRASSVPRIDSVETPAKQKLRKRSISTDNPVTPNRILTRRQSTLLDRIEENVTLDTPTRATGKRAFVDVDETPKTPTTMGKRTRKTSTSSADTPQLTTPRRINQKNVLAEDNTQTPKGILTRRSSVSKDTPKTTPKALPKTPTAGTKTVTTKSRAKKPLVTPDDTTEEESSHAQISDSDVESINEVISSPDEVSKKRSGRTLFTKSSSSSTGKPDETAEESAASVSEAYSSSRRLTRNQQSFMEKTLLKSPPVVPKKVVRRRGSKTEESPSKHDDHVSETESVASTRSKRSTSSVTEGNRRNTRSASNLKPDDDDASSAGSTRSKRSTKSSKAKASKDKNLGAILEEDQENTKNYEADDDNGSTHSGASKEPSKKKDRAKKSQK